MADGHSLYERLLDVTVFLPLGAALSLSEELPTLAGRGRERLGKQLEVARTVGRLAVREGQRRVASVTPSIPFRANGESRQAPATSPGRHAGARAPATSVGRQDTQAEGGGEVPEAESLPIPGYATLAASQVVQRLSSLRQEELAAVRDYELATRGRRTILHRISQLSSPDRLSQA